MDRNTEYFISLLSSFINKEKPALIKNIDWNQIYNLGKIHSLSGILYLMAKGIKEEYKPSSELLKQMKKDFIKAAILSASQENETNNIIRALNEAKISHVLMKGCVIRNYYPAKEMRTMGDIDILIKQQDRKKSHNLLKSMGYTPGNTFGEVWNYTKGNVHFEIHTHIMCRNMHNGTNYVGYFSGAWNHVVQALNPYTFEFNREYHFVYLMVHMAKHFDGSGCGIRMILDIALYLNYFKNSLDWSYIDKEIEKLNLSAFSKNIYILCTRWFGTSINFKLPSMEKDFYDKLSHYILSAGTFGFYQRNPNAATLRNEYLENKVKHKSLFEKFSIINVYRKKLFPSYESMLNSQYCWLIKNKPLLLPIAWIYKFLRCAFKDPKKLLSLLFGIAKSREESKKQYEIFSKLGL
jgi:hypothetical protein